MKRISVLLLTLLLTLTLTACDGGTTDIIGEYGGKIQESKEELEKGLGELQKAVDEVVKDVSRD